MVNALTFINPREAIDKGLSYIPGEQKIRRDYCGNVHYGKCHVELSESKTFLEMD